jgi:hypothetical protein
MRAEAHHHRHGRQQCGVKDGIRVNPVTGTIANVKAPT